MTAQSKQLNPTDILVLRAVNRFRYLTAAQLNRLLWPNNTRDNDRHAQRRLRRLVKDGYLLVLQLPRPVQGTAPHVHALGRRGRTALLALGERVPDYYRPSEITKAAENPLFMPHTLAVIDVLVAADGLTDDTSGVRLKTLHLERDLRRLRPRVTVPGIEGYAAPRQVTVIPDAVFSLTVGDTVQHFILEVDRDTERRPRWQMKVATLVHWLDSPRRRALVPGEYATVMVVTPTPRRREQLRGWTEQELRARGLFHDYANVFAFSSASPVHLNPRDFFAGKHWYPPYQDAPESLIDIS
jgi:hypothetical protein